MKLANTFKSIFSYYLEDDIILSTMRQIYHGKCKIAFLNDFFIADFNEAWSSSEERKTITNKNNFYTDDKSEISVLMQIVM